MFLRFPNRHNHLRMKIKSILINKMKIFRMKNLALILRFNILIKDALIKKN